MARKATQLEGDDGHIYIDVVMNHGLVSQCFTADMHGGNIDGSAICFSFAGFRFCVIGLINGG